MYEWLLFAHLVGLAFLLAGLGVHVVSVERLRSTPRVTDMQVLLASAKNGERLVFIGAGVLVIAGLALAARFWSFRDGWIATSIGLVIAQGIVGSIMGRRMDGLRGTLESAPDGVPSSDAVVVARSPVLHASNRISVVMVVEILFLMSVKPAFRGILWSLLAAAGIGTVAIWPLFTRQRHQQVSTGPARRRTQTSRSGSESPTGRTD
jgi:hypothetical protein